MRGNDERARSLVFEGAKLEKMRAALAAKTRVEGDCIVWFGPRNDNGYGVTGGALCTEKRRRIYVHRAAWAIANGGLPDGRVVRHMCDNPPCCNPAHLVIGRTADNNGDTIERWKNPRRYGTWTARGERHRDHKLTEEQVREIRRRHAAGETQRALADEYGVANPSIWLIVHRRSWTHVE